jgi:hypothetical protein
LRDFFHVSEQMVFLLHLSPLLHLFNETCFASLAGFGIKGLPLFEISF